MKNKQKNNNNNKNKKNKEVKNRLGIEGVFCFF